MLGDVRQTRGIFLNIREGNIISRQNGDENQHAYVEGVIQKITLLEREAFGERRKYWYIDIRCDKTDETYVLSLRYNSGVFMSIILSLSSEAGLIALKSQKPIKIETYLKNDFTKVRCSTNGVRLSWVVGMEGIPPLKEVHVGDTVVKDYTDRMKCIEGYVAKLQDILTFFS